MSNELKPCPFCGGELYEDMGNDEWSYQVCNSCGCRMSGKREALNRRADVWIIKVLEIANNALYFNDRSDYQTALYQILRVIKPDMFDEDGYLKEKLKYMEFREEDSQ